jgi:hypothetical protein
VALIDLNIVEPLFVAMLDITFLKGPPVIALAKVLTEAVGAQVAPVRTIVVGPLHGLMWQQVVNDLCVQEATKVITLCPNLILR